MAYEDVFFPSIDGVTLEGWFIPADSDRLVICNHPMPCNRYGYPGHLEPRTDFGGFEVNFLPEYKVLHDAGYNILTYDDFTMPPSYVQTIYDTISATDKKLFWIEGTNLRFQGYNYFGEHPELLLKWFGTHVR